MFYFLAAFRKLSTSCKTLPGCYAVLGFYYCFLMTLGVLAWAVYLFESRARGKLAGASTRLVLHGLVAAGLSKA